MFAYEIRLGSNELIVASAGRGFLAALSTASVVGFINVYGDVELNSLDSFWNSLFPKV